MTVYRLWWELLKHILWRHGNDTVWVDGDAVALHVGYPNGRDNVITIETDRDDCFCLDCIKEGEQLWADRKES